MKTISHQPLNNRFRDTVTRQINRRLFLKVCGLAGTGFLPILLGCNDKKWAQTVAGDESGFKTNSTDGAISDVRQLPRIDMEVPNVFQTASFGMG